MLSGHLICFAEVLADGKEKYAIIHVLLSSTCALNPMPTSLLKETIDVLSPDLSGMSKTLERFVASELRHYLDTNGFNDLFQSAYRPKHSTETALVRIHEDLMQAVDSRRNVLVLAQHLTR